MLRLYVGGFVLALLGYTTCAHSQAPLRNRRPQARPPVQVIAAARQDETGLRFTIRNNAAALQGMLTVNSGARAFKASLSLPAGISSPPIEVPADYLVTGANRVHFQWGAGLIDTLLYNWSVLARGIAFEKIDLSTVFNARIAQMLPSMAIDEQGLRKLAAESGEILLPQGIPFYVITDTFRNNILIASKENDGPDTAAIKLAGQASHIYLMLAGSAIPRAGVVNGEIRIQYADSTADTLRLISRHNWPSMDRDERGPSVIPILRLYLKSGETISPSNNVSTSKEPDSMLIDGGAATILDLPLDPSRELRSLSLRAMAGDVVIGLVGITLARN